MEYTEVGLKQEQNKLDEYGAVFISFEVDAKANKFLTEAASKSGRTKRQEARLRLHDHLHRFASISELKKAEERK